MQAHVSLMDGFALSVFNLKHKRSTTVEGNLVCGVLSRALMFPETTLRLCSMPWELRYSHWENSVEWHFLFLSWPNFFDMVFKVTMVDT